MMSTAPTTTITSDRLLRRSREALSALAVEFLLGMIVNLLPDDGPAARVLHPIVLGLHVLVGIGVVVVAVRLLIVARREAIAARAAAWALVVVAATFAAGVLTVLLRSELLSFLMAAGFLASTLMYVRTLLIGAAVARAA
jgi:heme A synthase